MTAAGEHLTEPKGGAALAAGRPSAAAEVALAPEARGDRDEEDADDHAQRDGDRDLRRPVDRLPAVDERDLVGVQRLEDELDPDEPEDHREAQGEVDEALQEAAQ